MIIKCIDEHVEYWRSAANVRANELPPNTFMFRVLEVSPKEAELLMWVAVEMDVMVFDYIKEWHVTMMADTPAPDVLSSYCNKALKYFREVDENELRRAKRKIIRDKERELRRQNKWAVISNRKKL